MSVLAGIFVTTGAVATGILALWAAAFAFQLFRGLLR